MAGGLGDRIGAKRVFVRGFGLFTLASVACGLAPRIPVLVGGRAVQGVGAAALVPSSLSLLSHTYPDVTERARAIGLYLAASGAALCGGPLVDGILITSFSWRAIFFINVPIAIVGMYLASRWANETPRTSVGGVDLSGQVAAMVALAALVVATIAGGADGFTNPSVVGGFALTGLAGMCFIAIELRAASPMLPLGLFSSRTFSTSMLIALLTFTVFYGLIFVLSVFFQR